MNERKPYITEKNDLKIEYTVYVNGYGYVFKAIENACNFVTTVIGHALDKDSIHGMALYVHLIESEEIEK